MGYYGQCNGVVDVAWGRVLLFWVDGTKVRLIDDHAVIHSNVCGGNTGILPSLLLKLMVVVPARLFPDVFANGEHVHWKF